MTEKIHGNNSLICDNCGDGEEEFDSWQDLQEYIKDNDWQTKFTNYKWMHFCPNCREDKQ